MAELLMAHQQFKEAPASPQIDLKYSPGKEQKKIITIKKKT
jgi:hypothetical protein